MRWLLIVVWLVAGCAQAVTADATTSWWNDSPWNDPDRGFHWYPEPKPQPRDEKPQPPEEKPKTIYEMATLEEIKKELERIKGVAIVNPTQENILEFLKAQNFVMDKASMFADVSRRVMWGNPDVDYAARSSPATYARQKIDARRDEQRSVTLKNLSETHGILFFARSDCHFCHDQAPLLKAFSKEYGVPVLAVSMDGGQIPFFPDARPDNGISVMASNGQGVNIVPMLFLIERSTNKTIPLGAGVIAVKDLAERVRVLTQTQPGESF